MTLASLEFLLVFLPLVVLGYGALGRMGSPMGARALLVVASLVFYGVASPRYLPLLVASAVFNHLVARAIRAAPAGPARRRRLWLGLGVDLLVLCFFKYSAFLVTNVAALTGLDLPAPRLAFPLGVSFFTLQQVVYLVDCYEGLTEPFSLLDHLLFQTFFPVITSGPIVRAKDLRPTLQAKDAAVLRADDLALGLYVLALGLFKKAVLADTLGLVADAGFDFTGRLSTAEAWLSSLAYTFQIYFDFSGYSDMAVGAALLLGFKLPQNFDSPLRATSIIDFWRRWHITLSNVITTYLYTPLVRLKEKVTFGWAMTVTVAAMAIAGLWHGPAWTFVIFGALHGVGLVVNQVWKKRKRKLPKAIAWVMTFVFVNVGFVFFRSAGVGAAIAVLRSMFSPTGRAVHGAFESLRLLDRAQIGVVALAAVAVCFAGKNSGQLAAEFRPGGRSLVILTVAAVLGLFFLNGVHVRGFVYHDF